MPQTPSAFGSGAQSGASAKPLGFQTSKRLLETLVHEYNLTTNFANGYRNREDIAILLAGTMVAGSQNVLTNTYRRLQNRQGYVIYGAEDNSGAPILSWFDYPPIADGAAEVHGRAGFLSGTNNGKLQFLYTTKEGDYFDGTTYAVGVPLWIDLLTDLTSVNFNTTQWSPTITPANSATQDPASLILMVNGTNLLYTWTGAISTIASANNNSGIIGDFSVSEFSPGQGYQVGDNITVVGGTNAAVGTVASVVNGVIGGVAIAQAGTGYVVGDLISPQNVPGINGEFFVATVGSLGEVVGLSVYKPGEGYVVQNSITTTGGSGGHGSASSILKVDITSVLNNAVQSILFSNPGSGYSPNNGVSTTTTGGGTGLEIDILSVETGEIILNGLSATQQNFLASPGGTPSFVVINGTAYQYLFANGNALIGVTPSPVMEPTQSIIFQQPRNYSVAAIVGYTLPTISLISALNSQVYYGTLTDTSIFISKVLNFLDCTSSSIPNFTGTAQGDGGQLNLDVPPTAFLPQVANQDVVTMSVFGGEDFLYNVNTTFGATTVGMGTDAQSIPTQQFTVAPQKLTRKQGAQSQKWTTKNKNDIIYLSFTPTLNSFGLVDNILQTQQIKNLSYPIINDMNVYDFTDGSVTFDKDFVYACVPKEGLFRIYNQTDQTTYLGDTPSMQETKNNFYWEAPQTVPLTGISIINGNLYGHSYASSETYQLFTGWRDRATALNMGGTPILAKAVFAYNNYGVRFYPKFFKGYYFEGNITSNTTLNISVYYDYSKNGSTTLNSTFLGTSRNVLPAAPNNSLGKVSEGINPIGTTLIMPNPNGTPNPFRVIKDFAIQPFFQEQTSLFSNMLDAQWQIVALGTNANTTPEGANFIHEA